MLGVTVQLYVRACPRPPLLLSPCTLIFRQEETTDGPVITATGGAGLGGGWTATLPEAATARVSPALLATPLFSWRSETVDVKITGKLISHAGNYW